MAKFEKGERVLVRDSSSGHRVSGKITQTGNKKRRVVTDDGRRLEASLRDLEPLTDRILLLEGRLDRRLSSKRLYGEMFERLMTSFGIDVLHERVHSKIDLKEFLKREAKSNIRFIHLIGHGIDLPGCGTAIFRTTFENIPLGDKEVAQDLFGGLDGKIIILSTCEIGADQRVLQTIKEAANAAAVIAYRTPVDDWYAIMVETMLYDRLINAGMSPQLAVGKVTAAVKMLGAKMDDIHVKKPILVCE